MGDGRRSPLYDGQRLPASVVVDSLAIHKRSGRMDAYAAGRWLKRYRVAVGIGGLGPKRYEGDRRTPEGEYHLVSRHPSARYHRFLMLSYPNATDRQRFARELRARRIPRGARIGGAIGIHGTRRGFALLPHKWVNWTQGCIALDNSEIEELYRALAPRARVLIDAR